MRAKPDLHRSLLRHLAQLKAGGARNADARNGRHLGLGILRRRIAPHRLHRAERHCLVLGMPPIHHDGADRALQTGDALLLVTRGRIGQLGEDDLAAGILAHIVGERAAADIDDLGANAVLGSRQAMAERVGLDRDLRRRLDAKFGVLGK